MVLRFGAAAMMPTSFQVAVVVQAGAALTAAFGPAFPGSPPGAVLYA